MLIGQRGDRQSLPQAVSDLILLQVLRLFRGGLLLEDVAGLPRHHLRNVVHHSSVTRNV